MRSYVWTVAAATAMLLALAAAAARRADQDFEFDDDAELASAGAVAGAGAGATHSRPPRRYVFEPHNSLCRSLVCKKREVCVLKDAFTALCANKKDILRKGDIIAAPGGRTAGGRQRERDDDDVFYDGSARDLDADADLDADDAKPDRCVGCGARPRAQFLCGSDNRTYSSLCRLDLHNCVRRAQPGARPVRPVRPACRGFCPCRRARARPRARAHPRHYDDNRLDRPAADEVFEDRRARRRPAQGSEGCALDEMANRLLDWFSVLMEEAGATLAPARGVPRAGFPDDCKPEVRWTFGHLDADGDGLLSPGELYALRHDERERCLRPFLASCGAGGAGGAVTRGAWCACLRRAARPCTALARARPRGGQYVPACDARGFYRARQCHAALGVCWCVDPHGVELPGSRTKGAPACPGEKTEDGAEGAEGAPADDEDGAGAGSGDAELRF